MNNEQREYLMGLGLITDKDTIRHEHLGVAMAILRKGGVNNKAHNRFTGPSATLSSLMAKQIGRDKGYANKEMAIWLERFRAKYDKNDPRFANVVPPKVVEIITPWQLLYLISLTYPY